MKKLLLSIALLSIATNCHSMDPYNIKGHVKNFITDVEKSKKKDNEREVANKTKQKETLYFHILKLEKEITDLQTKFDSCQKWRILKKRYLQKKLINKIKLLENRNEQHNELEQSIANLERSIDLLEKLIEPKN